MNKMAGDLAVILAHETILGWSSELDGAVVSSWNRAAMSFWMAYKVFYTVKDNLFFFFVLKPLLSS